MPKSTGGAVGCVLFLVFLYFMWGDFRDVVNTLTCNSSSPSTTTSYSPPAPAPQAAQPVMPAGDVLEFGSIRFTIDESRSYATVTGQVTNITNQPLKDIEAVANFYDKAGNFITSSDALISYNPILAGQTSPFEVMHTYNPAMHSVQVEFKELMGGSLRARRK